MNLAAQMETAIAARLELYGWRLTDPEPRRRIHTDLAVREALTEMLGAPVYNVRLELDAEDGPCARGFMVSATRVHMYLRLRDTP